MIINQAHWGLIYRNEIFQPIRVGQKLKGYIKEVRPDGKIDVRLQPDGYVGIDALGRKIIEKMEDNGGILDVSDKTAPEIIYKLFGCSKKNYKKAIGALYRQGIIDIGEEEIRLKAEE